MLSNYWDPRRVSEWVYPLRSDKCVLRSVHSVCKDNTATLRKCCCWQCSHSRWLTGWLFIPFVITLECVTLVLCHQRKQFYIPVRTEKRFNYYLWHLLIWVILWIITETNTSRWPGCLPLCLPFSQPIVCSFLFRKGDYYGLGRWFSGWECLVQRQEDWSLYPLHPQKCMAGTWSHF